MKPPEILVLESLDDVLPFDALGEGEHIRVLHSTGTAEIGVCTAIYEDDHWRPVWTETREVVLKFPLRVIRYLPPRGYWPERTEQ